jgi:hypothetical protein
MKMILALAIAAAVAVVYAFWLRSWLKQHAALKRLYASIEPIEAKLWARSRTILSARLYWIAGALIGLHDFVAPMLLSSGLDWQSFVPPEYQRFYPLVLIGTGLLFEWLRRLTSAPLHEKE